MATITLRSAGSALTNAQIDANFTNLNNDKLDLSPSGSQTVGGAVVLLPSGTAVTPHTSANVLTLTTSSSAGMSILADTGAHIFFGKTGATTAGRVSYTNASNSMEIFTNATEAIHIDSSQQVGLGKTPADGILDINLATEDFAIVDAGSTGATYQDWVEVTVGGNTGYIRIFATK